MKLNFPFIVTTNGISYGSLQQIGEILPSQTFGTAHIQPFVDAANGNLLLKTFVSKIEETAFPIEHFWIYNAKAPSPKESWRLPIKRFRQMPKPPTTHPFDTQAVLIEEDGYETRYQGDGQQNKWVAPTLGDGTPYLRYDTVEQVWVWFHPKTQIKEYYNQQGYLIKRENAKNQPINYEYDESQNPWVLKAIVVPAPSAKRYEMVRQQMNNGGFQVDFYVVSDKDRLLCQSNQFDQLGRLVKTIIPTPDQLEDKWYTIAYTYHADTQYLNQIIQSDGTVLSFDFDRQSVPSKTKIRSISPGDNKQDLLMQTRFTFSDGPTPYVLLEDIDKAQNKILLDSQHRIIEVDRDQGFPIMRIPAGEGPDKTLFTYNQDGHLGSISKSGNLYQKFEFQDPFGLKTREEGSEGQVAEYYYENGYDRHQLVIEANTANGKDTVTRKVFDNHFNSDSKAEVLPHGLFLRFKISPEGRVTEYRPDSSGNIASVRIYTEGLFTGYLPVRLAPTLDEMLQWVSQQDPTNVKLTRFAYNNHGQEIFRHDCAHVDKNGEGIEDAGMSVVFRGPDIYGNVLSSYELQKAGDPPQSTEQRFDGVGRLNYHSNALQERTTHDYKDAQTLTVLPNGRKEISHYDNKGYQAALEKIVTTDGKEIIRATQLNHQVPGCGVKCTSHPDGGKTVAFYDRQRRLGYEVSRTGQIVEHRYNNTKRYTATVSYAKLIDPTRLFDANDPTQLPTPLDLVSLMKDSQIENPAFDRVCYEFFDLSKRLQYKVDAENYVTEIKYDALNRPIATIIYDAKLTEAQLAQLKNGEIIALLFDSTKDTCARKFYDKDGLMIGEQDPAGYVTEYVRNGAGWIIEKRVYANNVPISLSVQDFAAIRPKKDTLRDGYWRYYHNNRGLPELEVEVRDNDIFVTQNNYLACGLIQRKRVYSNPIDQRWLKNRKTRPILPAQSTDDLVTLFDYDALNREVHVQDTTDLSRKTIYDNMGQVTHNILQDEVAALNRNYSPCPLSRAGSLLFAEDYFAGEGWGEGHLIAPHIPPHPSPLPQGGEGVGRGVTLNQRIDGDTYRATVSQIECGQEIAKADPIIAEKLARVDADAHLSSPEKQKAKTEIWQNLSKRHTYDSTGLKLKTAVRLGDDKTAKDQITYFYYDKERRPIISITLIENNKVLIQENSLNTFGEVIATRLYSQSGDKIFPPQYIANLTGGILSDDLGKILTAIQDPKDQVTKRMLNKRGLPETLIDAAGNVSKRRYNARKDLIEEKMPLSSKNPELTITHRRDTRGNEVETIKTTENNNEIRESRKFESPYNQETAYTDPENTTTIKDRDRQGYLKAVTKTKNGKSLIIKKILKRDALHRVISKVDGVGNETNIEHKTNTRERIVHRPVQNTDIRFKNNVFNEKVQRTNAALQIETWAHTSTGKVCNYTDALKAQIISRYDLVDKLSVKKNRRGISSSYSRNLASKVTAKIEDSEGAALTTQFQRNALNQAESVIDPNNTLTKNTFEARGLTANRVVDPDHLGLSETTTYNPDTSVKQMTQGSSSSSAILTRDNGYDAFGRDQSTTIEPRQNQPGDKPITTSQILNRANKVICGIDANRNKTWHFYDEFGREALVVNAMGGVREWDYNDINKIRGVRTYNTGMTAQNLAKITESSQLADVKAMCVTSSFDTTIYYFYDVNQRECFSVSLLWDTQQKKYLGVIREKRFDGDDRPIQDILYYKTFFIDDINSLSTEKLIALTTGNQDPKNDRHTYYVLDANGRARFIIEEMDEKKCVVTEQRFDEDGHLIAKIDYATLIENAAVLATLTPDEVFAKIPKDSNRDRACFTVWMPYENVCRPKYTVDAEGHVVKYGYDKNKNKVMECHFKTSLHTIPNEYDKLVALLEAMVPDPSKDAITQFEYNAANKLIKQTDALGHSDQFIRDECQNIKQHIDRNGKVWKFEYDNKGRETKKTAPKVKIITNVKYDPTNPGKILGYDEVEVAVETNIELDANGNMLGKIKASNTSEAISSRATFDACNQKITTDCAGKSDPNTVIETNSVYNSKQKKVAHRDENGQWHFIVYDSQERELYRINPQGGVIQFVRNTNDEVITEIHFAKSLGIDLTRYQNCDQGVPIDVILTALKTSDDDQVKTFVRNKRGDIILERIESRKLPGAQNPSPTQVTYTCNAFREWVKKSILIDQAHQVTQDEIRWMNRNAKVVAECDAAQKVTIKSHDSFGNLETTEQWANPPKKSLTPEMTIAEIKAQHVLSDRDVIISYVRDLLGQVLMEKQTGVTLQVTKQDPATGLYSIQDVASQDIILAFKYSPTQQKIACKDAKGNWTYFYYNDRGDKIAEAGVTRKIESPDGSLTQVRSFKTFLVNALGTAVKTTNYAKGVAATVDEKSLPLPTPDPVHDQVSVSRKDALNREVSQLTDPSSIQDKYTGLEIASQMHLDHKNKPIAKIDPNGNCTRYFYDENGNCRFEIRPDGGVTEKYYDVRSLCQFSCDYEVGLTPEELAALTDTTPLATVLKIMTAKRNPTKDTVTRHYYENGREVYTVKLCWNTQTKTMQGFVDGFQYNSAAQAIQTTHYAEPITMPTKNLPGNDELTSSDIAKLVNPNPLTDRTTYHIRDATNRERFTIKPNGAIIERQFDTFGNMTMEKHYARTVNDPKTLASLPVDQIAAKLKLDPDNDRTTYRVFNAANKCEFVIKPKGNVKRLGYDNQWNIIGSTKYAATITPAATYDEIVKQCRNMPVNLALDRTTVYTYNAAKQCMQHYDANVKGETYQRDIYGNVLTAIDRMGTKSKKHYDHANRLDIETAPPVSIVQITDNHNGTLTPVPQGKIGVEKHTQYDKASNTTAIIAGANTGESRTFQCGFDKNNQPNATRVDNVNIDNPATKASYASPPIIVNPKKPSVTTAKFYNAKKLLISEQKENGYWKFHLYDNQGREIYTLCQFNETQAYVIKKKRNRFGDEIELTYFANPVSLNFASYANTGLPQETLESAIRISNDDYTITRVFNRSGLPEDMQQSEVFYYIPGAIHGNLRESPKTGRAKPHTKLAYNAFNELTYRGRQIDPTLQTAWAEDCSWFDKNGKLAATSDPSGDVVYSIFNSFDEETKKTECATPCPQSHNQDLSLAALLQLLKTSDDDRKILTNYYRTGKVQQRIRQNVQFSEYDSSAGTLKTVLKRGDLSENFFYNANEKLIGHQDENGNFIWKFYNDRGDMIAETGMPFSNPNSTNKQVPVTYYGFFANGNYSVSVHGENVYTKRCYGSTALYTNPTTLPTLPAKPADDLNDQYVMKLFDNRGLEAFCQIGNGLTWTRNFHTTGYTYSATRKQARSFQTVTSPNPNNRFSNISHMYEERFIQDGLDRKIGHRYVVDGNEVPGESTYWGYDMLDQMRFENATPDFSNPGKYFMYHGRQLYATGIGRKNQVLLTDLALRKTAVLESPAPQDSPYHLRTPAYTSLESILQRSSALLERSEFSLDNAGRIESRTLPKDDVPLDSVSTIVLNVCVTQIGNKTFLTWPTPLISLPTTFLLSQKGTANIIHLPIVNQSGLSSVDVSDCLTDAYEYRIDYSQGTVNLFASSGTLQIDTGKTNDGKGNTSHNLVALMQSDTLLHLTGNTMGVGNTVELWQGATHAPVKVIKDPKTQALTVDLSGVISGEYQIGLTGSLEPSTASFTVYSHQPSAKPISREIPVKLNLQTIDKQGELSWELPDTYLFNTVNFTCDYLDDQGNSHSETFTNVDPTKLGKPYQDKNGQLINSNLTFQFPVKEVKTVSLSLQLNTTESIPLFQGIAPTNPNPNWQPNVMQTISFAPRDIVYLTSWPSLNTPPTFQYLDNTTHNWVQVQASGITQEGFCFDATNISSGIYPFILNNTTAQFSLGHGGIVYPGNQKAITQKQMTMQPAYSYRYDPWSNATYIQGTLKNVTTKSFDHNNSPLSISLPTVKDWDEHGNVTLARPQFQYRYDRKGHFIATIDPYGHQQVNLLNDAGLLLVKYLGDGTISTTQYWDCLHRITAIEQRFGRKDYLAYDYQDNPLRVQLSGTKKLEEYQYDENSNRTQDTRSYQGQSNTITQIYDIKNRVKVRIDGGNRQTTFGYHRSDQLILEQNFDGSKRIYYDMDYAGIWARHKDLTQSKIDDPNQCYTERTFDQKMQVLTQISTGGDHGKDLKMIAMHTFHGMFFMPVEKSTALQNLKFSYRWGDCVEEVDYAEGRRIVRGFDTEHRPTSLLLYETNLGVELLRRSINTSWDPLGREEKTTDGIMQLEMGYNLCSNTRCKLVSLNGILVAQSWNVFDGANQALVSDGVLNPVTKNIGITPPQGMQSQYGGGFRLKQRSFDKDYGDAWLALNYVDNALVSLTKDTNGIFKPLLMSWTTDMRDRLIRQEKITYKTKGPFPFPRAIKTTLTNTLDGSGFVINQTQQEGDKHPVVTHFVNPNSPSAENFIAGGLAIFQTTDYQDDDHNVDTLTNSYIGVERFQKSVISGIRKNKHGTSPVGVVHVFHDANGGVSGKAGNTSKDGKSKNLCTLFKNTVEGTPIDRIAYQVNVSGFLHFNFQATDTPIYINVLGQPILNYSDSGDSSLPRKLVKPEAKLNKLAPNTPADLGNILSLTRGLANGVGIDGGFQIGAEGWNGFFKAMRKRQFELYSPVKSVNQTYPNGGSSVYVTQPGDTFETISKTFWGTPDYAPLIALYNNWQNSFALPPGETLYIPALLNAEIKPGMSQPYDELVSVLLGSLYPYLKTPKEHHSFLSKILPVIIGALVVVVAPFLAAEVLGFATVGAVAGVATATGLGSTVLFSLVTGAIAGLLDAAAQGLAVATGLESKFNWQETVMTALGAGISAGVGTMTQGMIASKGILAEQLTRTATTMVLQQLGAMAAGITDKLDIDSILTALAASLIDCGIDSKLGNPVAVKAAEAVTDNIVSGVVRGKISVENMAVQAIGTLVGNELGKDINAEITKEAASMRSHEAVPTTTETKPSTSKPVTSMGSSSVDPTFDIRRADNNPDTQFLEGVVAEEEASTSSDTSTPTTSSTKASQSRYGFFQPSKSTAQAPNFLSEAWDKDWEKGIAMNSVAEDTTSTLGENMLEKLKDPMTYVEAATEYSEAKIEALGLETKFERYKTIAVVGRLGKALPFLGAGIGIYKTATAEEGSRLKTGLEEVGSFLGGMAGGVLVSPIATVETGMTLGFGLPMGFGIEVGGIVGGSAIGKTLGDVVYDNGAEAIDIAERFDEETRRITGRSIWAGPKF